jgi:hypothetical protein
MKTPLLIFALFGILGLTPISAQNVTTVNATSNEISDNLDLRAVASIFGEAQNLEDFERRINDPRNKISNLDLNFDRQVDYLRVIEAVENNTHLIILQAVLERDVYQDVATIEVERDRNNQVQVQVVGDVFMYGPNYIYEPVFVRRPVIYNMFWVNNYNPYFSPYYFNYYPTYYYAWTPYPIYRYRRNVHVHINQHNYYNYCTDRRSSRAVAMYETRRNNGYERQHPNQAFTTRNTATNRYELEQTRNSGRRVADAGIRSNTSIGSESVRSATATTNVRNTNPVRNSAVRSTTPSLNVRSSASNQNVRSTTTRNETQQSTVRSSTVRNENVRNNANQGATNRNYTQQLPSRNVEKSATTSRSSSQSNAKSTRNNTSTRSNVNTRG